MSNGALFRIFAGVTAICMMGLAGCTVPPAPEQTDNRPNSSQTVSEPEKPLGTSVNIKQKETMEVNYPEDSKDVGEVFSLTEANLADANWSNIWQLYMHRQEDGSLRLGGGVGSDYCLGAYENHTAFYNRYLEMDLFLQLSELCTVMLRAGQNSGQGPTNPSYALQFQTGDKTTLRVERQDGTTTVLQENIVIDPVFDYYDYNRFKIGILNEGEGVRIRIRINGTLVVDLLDETPGTKLTGDGYLFFQGGHNMITLKGTDKGLKPTAAIPVKTGEYQGLPCYDLSAMDRYTSRDLLTVFSPRLFTSSEGLTLPYRIYLPANYSPDQKLPLVLWLHGGGLRGSDNTTQVTGDENQKRALLNYQKEEPFILIVPQCPDDRFWGDSMTYDGRYHVTLTPENESITIRALRELTLSAAAEFSADQKRLYVGGCSMGGMGSYDLLYRYPDLYAAALIGCAASDPSKAEVIKNTPVYLIHGTIDNVVEVEGSRNMDAALKEVNADYRYTEYPQRDHAVVLTTEMDEPLAWIFSKTR
ncbi:MAG: hypothetical protein E7486_03100 [Ruminococcaceae bacterium]|nr:hypothetical protein [Oscillospiraceae bacterium]